VIFIRVFLNTAGRRFHGGHEADVYRPMISLRCDCPQRCSSPTTCSSDWPCSVMVYSTLGGNSSTALRFIKLLASSAFNSLDSVLSLIPLTDLVSCRNRWGPVDRAKRINNFHRPSSTSSASLIDRKALGQSALFSILVLSFTSFVIAVTSRRDSAFRQGSIVPQEAGLSSLHRFNSQYDDKSG